MYSVSILIPTYHRFWFLALKYLFFQYNRMSGTQSVVQIVKIDIYFHYSQAKLGDMTVGCMMCKACMVPVNSEVIWNSHSKGRNHKKQVNFLHKASFCNIHFALLIFDFLWLTSSIIGMICRSLYLDSCMIYITPAGWKRGKI